jgi:hypothetical protein
VGPEERSFFHDRQALFRCVLLEQNANSVTLGREQGEKDNILRANIAALRPSTVSAMPEGIEEEITVEEMTDLLEYLKSLGGGD